MMRNLKILAFVGILISTLASCDETEGPVYNGDAVGLNQTLASISVPITGSTETFPVSVTKTSSVDRTFGLEFVGDAPVAGGVSLGAITVLADSYEGTASVNFDFDAITLADGQKDIFSVKATSDNTEVFGTVLEIEYFKAIVCNDATLFIQGDRYAGETGFSIEDDMGNVVYTMPGGSLSSVAAGATPTTFTAPITLADGCYVAVITDSYGDGQGDSANGDGFFRITCSIATFATGGGQFTTEDRVPFCVNQ
jgi:hypothetical protein